MFKNFIIVVLVFILCSLLFQNKQNVDILVENMAETTEKIDRATINIEDVIEENFPPKEFEVKDNLDIPSLNLQKEPTIREETFFDEK